MTKHRPGRRGQSLVEMALVALVLYLLLAATVDLGRATFSVQVIEDAARVAARELALLPFPPTATTRGAIDSDEFRRRVFDPNWLVIDLQDLAAAGVALEDLRLPPVNEQLRPLYVLEEVAGRRVLRYPGAVVESRHADLDTESPDVNRTNNWTVRIPQVRYESGGGETFYGWVDVVEPVVDVLDGATDDPFPVSGSGLRQGLAALRVNYPFQAATIGNFREDPLDPDRFDPNITDVTVANDQALIAGDTSGEVLVAEADPDLADPAPAPRYGAYGLGAKAAQDQIIRPFRRVQTAQAVFRREIFGN